MKDNGQGMDMEQYGKKLFGQRFLLDIQKKGVSQHITRHILERNSGSFR